MADILVTIAALAALAGIGRVRISRRIARLNERRSFTVEFLNKFQEYGHSRGEDHDALQWLLLHSSRMQTNLGGYGRMDMRPPFANYVVKNWPIVPNVLMEMQQSFPDRALHSQGIQYAQYLQNTLMTYLGSLNDVVESAEKELGNPIIWLREGVQVLLLAPLTLLGWLGVMATPSVNAVSTSRIFRVLAGILAAVSIISAIVGLVVGWGDFLTILQGAL